MATRRHHARAALLMFTGMLLAFATVATVPAARAGLFPMPWPGGQSDEAATVEQAVHAALDAAAPLEKLALPIPMPVEIIRRVDNPHRWIAITFDACATQSQANGFDRPLFRVVQRERIPATIFTSGRWVEFHPEAMKELVAEPLIEFANHSYAHPHMTRLSVDEIAAELDRTEAVLGRYGRQSVAFRPPFGEFDERVLQVARSKQIPAVLWDVVSGDPSARATAEGMIRSVVRKTRPGSIVIFHINGRETQTAAALPAILRQLRARGLEFVHLSKLLSAGVSKNSVDLVAGRLPSMSGDTAILPPSNPTAEGGVLPLAAAALPSDDGGAIPPSPTPVSPSPSLPRTQLPSSVVAPFDVAAE